MTLTPSCEGHVERFARAFAQHWGLEVDPLRNCLIGHLKRMAPVALDDARAVEASLARPALDYRNVQLRPILRDLFDWLRARLSHKLGPACHPYRDDAVSHTLMLLLDYWKPWWSRPEGQEHLRRYGTLAVVHTALRIIRGEKARESRLPRFEELQVADPETEAIHQGEERQRALAQTRLRDLDWLLEAGLTRAEANAVIRFLGPSPSAGLDKRAEAAWRKALQRAKARLKTLVDRLTTGGGPQSGSESGAPSYATVEHLGLRGRFEVADSSAHGLWLEGPVDEAGLELDADCTVHVHYRAAVIARGARVVLIERTGRKVRIALEFHFQPRCRSESAGTQPTL